MTALTASHCQDDSHRLRFLQVCVPHRWRKLQEQQQSQLLKLPPLLAYSHRPPHIWAPEPVWQPFDYSSLLFPPNCDIRIDGDSHDPILWVLLNNDDSSLLQLYREEIVDHFYTLLVRYSGNISFTINGLTYFGETAIQPVEFLARTGYALEQLTDVQEAWLNMGGK